MLWQQKRTQLPILNPVFAIQNKTQTQQNRYSITGIFCSNLDLSTSGEKPSLKSSFDVRGSPSKGWTVLATSISSLPLEYDVSQLSVELAEGRYTSLSDIISRLFQRWLIQNYKRCESFHSFLRHRANSLPVHGTHLRQNDSTLGPGKNEF